jgi:hypothetical protein
LALPQRTTITITSSTHRSGPRCPICSS